MDEITGRKKGSKPATKRLPLALPLTAAAAIAALLVGLILFNPFPVRALRDLVFDSYQRISPRPYDADVPVRVVAIDDASLARLGQWPWPRETLAALAGRLREAKAAVVAYDVLFAEYERTATRATDTTGPSTGDLAFAAAMAEGNVVIGQALTDRGAVPVVKPGLSFAGDDPALFAPRYGGVVPPVREYAAAAQGVGALNWVPDRDLVVRRVPTLFSIEGKLVPTFGMEALRVAQGAGSIVVRASNASGQTAFGAQTGISALRIGNVTVATDRDGSVRVRYAGTQQARRLSAADVIEGKFDAASIEGTIVLIGATAAALSDIRATPLEGAVPGIDIHAEVLEHLLSGASLTRPDWAPGTEALATILAALVAALLAARAPPLSGIALAFALVNLIAGGSFWSFLHQDRLLDPTMPVLATILVFGTTSVGALRRSQREGREIRDAFGRYVSPAVVAALAADPSRLSLGGQMREITVLFSDIRGFTARSESMQAEDVVAFLNAIHAPMTDEVLKSGGTLDKFIGDGMMAFWNAPLETPDHVRKALTCALAMQEALVPVDLAMRAALPDDGVEHVPLAIGIGIHTGPAAVGNLGSIRRFDYSAVGDTVNTAARIEQSSKNYGVPIIVSREVAEAAPDFAFFLIDVERLRGRQQETPLYGLHGGPTAKNAAFERFRGNQERVLRAVLAGDAEAGTLIAELERDPIGARYGKLHALYRSRLLQAA